MSATTSLEPYLATVRISLEIAPPTPKGGAEVWDELMEMLLRHPRIIDPVISNDLDSGHVSISFAFEATGNAHQDGLTALTFLADATRTAEPPSAFDWGR